jgi:tetratricopeptide (TPR) repeat protein
MLKNRQPDVNFPYLQEVKQKTRFLLRDLYSILMAYYWHVRKHLDKSMEYAHKVIKIDENNFNAHLNMAVFYWLKSDKQKAHSHTDRAWRIRPGHPLTRFNKAFFFLHDRNYEQALKQYKRIQYVGDTNIIDVIEFLEQEYEKAKDNAGFLFAAGWLNLKFADQLRGREQLLEFVAKSTGDSSYSVLIEEAKRVLNTRNES